MNHCLDLDRLVAIGAATEWQVTDVLDHLPQCRSCREELGRLAAVHDVLSAEEAPRPGWTEGVMRDLARRQARRDSARDGVIRLLTPILAAGTAFFALALVSSSATTFEVLPAIGAAVLASVVTAWWGGRRTEPQGLAR